MRFGKAGGAARSEALYGHPMSVERLDIFRSLLEPMKPGRLLDLGCGHGRFSLIARDLGWQVTGVDARTDRMPGTHDIDWVQSDVRDFAVYGYDCIALLGLLYHLELPAQLDLLRRCAPTSLILDTHVAVKPDAEDGGYKGRMFQEVAEGADLAACTTAAWGNEYSFWASPESLRQMLRDCGYAYSFELQPWYLDDRTFWLATG